MHLSLECSEQASFALSTLRADGGDGRVSRPIKRIWYEHFVQEWVAVAQFHGGFFAWLAPFGKVGSTAI